MLRFASLLLACAAGPAAVAASLRVPGDHATIQAALDAARPGDVVIVAPGRYRERIRLREGVTLRSAGGDERGAEGLRRAEATVLDGGGDAGDQPGVLMAEGATLDGFTVTNVGVYDEAVWKRHHASQGEELGDDEGAVKAEGTVPAIAVRGVDCTVTRCIVRHNGDAGIALVGAPDRSATPLVTDNVCHRNLGGGIGAAEGSHAVIRGNHCYENLRGGIGCRSSSPVVEGNRSHHNIRAGIGCREGATPVIRGNKCHHNRRAGIGIRMDGTAPVVVDNECFENDMAGIGCRDGASPVIRNNKCRRNRLAGIGCDGARPVIVANECTDNDAAGIGLRDKASAIIHDNRCADNKAVAIGVTRGSAATITGNRLSREGGPPPLVAVQDSVAALLDNRLEGGGVAAVLVQGTATLHGNTFLAPGGKPGNAVWGREGAAAGVFRNRFEGFRTAVNAVKANIAVAGNTVLDFGAGPAITVVESAGPPHVFGNDGQTARADAKFVEIRGPSGIVAENRLRMPDAPAK